MKGFMSGIFGAAAPEKPATPEKDGKSGQQEYSYTPE